MKIFKDKLSHSDFEGKRNIPRGLLENADRIDIKNILMKFYGGDTAVHVTIDIFTQINLTDSAAKLREGREKGRKPKVTVKPESLPQGSRSRRRKRVTAGMTNSESQQEAWRTQSSNAPSGPDSLTCSTPFSPLSWLKESRDSL